MGGSAFMLHDHLLKSLKLCMPPIAARGVERLQLEASLSRICVMKEGLNRGYSSSFLCYEVSR